MDSNVFCNKIMARRLGVGALAWLRRAGKTAVTVAVAALAFVTTVGAPQAYAANNLYPGEMCIKWTGAGIPKYYYGGVGNESTTAWLYLDCPLVTDPDEEGAALWASITYRDLHYSENITCTLYTVANSGVNGTYWIKTRGPISSNGSTYEPYSFLWLDVEAQEDKGDSVSYISCAVPPAYAGSYRSYILHYEMWQ